MNIQRFRQVLAYIEAHPQKWDQREWCGTSCCIAGHASRFATGVRPKAGYISNDTARTWLELSPEERGWLFDATRTLDDFRTVARRVYA